MTTIRRSTLAAALLAASFGAHAATTVTWDFTSGGDTSSPYANQSSWTIDGKTVTLRAFYVDAVANSTDSMGNSTVNSTVASSTASKAMKFGNGTYQAGVATFGGNGVGVVNTYDGPTVSGTGQESSYGGQHAVDNYDITSTGTYNPSSGYHAHDFLLFDFQEVLAPTDFRIGWKGFANTDIDIFIAPDTVTSGFDLSGKSVNDLIASGWTRATFTNVQDCVGTSATPCPTTFASASYSNSGGALSGMPANLKSRYMVAAGMLGGNDDAFKFASITMNVPGGGGGGNEVPVPAPLALLAIGGLAMAITRRRKAA